MSAHFSEVKEYRLQVGRLIESTPKQENDGDPFNGIESTFAITSLTWSVMSRSVLRSDVLLSMSAKPKRTVEQLHCRWSSSSGPKRGITLIGTFSWSSVSQSLSQSGVQQRSD